MQVVTAARCKHRTCFGSQRRAWFTELQTRSIVSGFAFFDATGHRRTTLCNRAKLRPKPSRSNAPRAANALPVKNSMPNILRLDFYFQFIADESQLVRQCLDSLSERLRRRVPPPGAVVKQDGLAGRRSCLQTSCHLSGMTRIATLVAITRNQHSCAIGLSCLAILIRP